MNQAHNKPNCRGVAMVVAVAILGVVAACIVMLVAMASGEFERSLHLRKQSQIQQYHLACILFARQQLQSGQKSDTPIQLPDWGPRANIKWISDDACEITVDRHTWVHQFAKSGNTFNLIK